jgi:SAM-dependent methyltransferase
MAVSAYKRIPSVQKVLSSLIRAEGWWFDWTRGVTTTGEAALSTLTLAGSPRDGFEYVPTRPAPTRRALRELPIRDHSDYTFIDLGSGKGRVLLIAAEFPFRTVLGVEFAMELHCIAQSNERRFKGSRRKCEQIESIHANAKDFQFPDENLVVYLFNPFPLAVMDRVLGNLYTSLIRCPRELFIILVFPELAPLLDTTAWLHLEVETKRHRIYRAVPAKSL